MTDPCQSTGRMLWQEFLSAHEVEQWAKCRKQPRKLWRIGGISIPGVYRFIFLDDRSCYVGIAGHLGERLGDHICPLNKLSRDPQKTASGWSVRGAIQNSLGKCYVQRMTIEGTVNIYGLKIAQPDLDDLFVRLLLENWAVLDAERNEKLRPRNRDIPRGIHQSTKDFLSFAKGNIARVGRRGELIERGGLETLIRRT